MSPRFSVAELDAHYGRFPTHVNDKDVDSFCGKNGTVRTPHLHPKSDRLRTCFARSLRESPVTLWMEMRGCEQRRRKSCANHSGTTIIQEPLEPNGEQAAFRLAPSSHRTSRKQKAALPFHCLYYLNAVSSFVAGHLYPRRFHETFHFAFFVV